MMRQIVVEVAYALPTVQRIISVLVPADATVGDAIAASKITEQFPSIDLTQDKVGIYGKLTTLDAPLRERDRIEIYRPLIADPKEIRRRRAAEGKAMRKNAGNDQ